MNLALSSAAAPDLGLDRLLEVCQRRGLTGIELVAGDGHGVHPGTPGERQAAGVAAATRTGVRLVGYRAATVAEACSDDAARLSAVLGAPVILPDGSETPPDLPDIGRRFASAGGRLLVGHGTEPGRVAALRAAITDTGSSSSIGLCWEVRPHCDDLSAAQAVILAAGEQLVQIRLYGGGPEAVSQTGHGIGALMARLTLARFSGAVVLTPSEARFHQAWFAWLRRNGGWGCGSKSADGTLVQLQA
jgi:hypothetical protein